MKKIYTFISLTVLTLTASSQVQRMVLVEEFTQASCGPCAAANPAFNTLLSNNSSKAVSIKYQVNWPGVDPMNAQYPAGPSARVSYYGLNSVPYAVMDGEAVTGASYVGYPGNLTQAEINTEYGITSPFSVNVSHYLNTANDSIFITATFTASQSFTSVGYLRGHIVLVEKHIDFTSPPGSNGETDFYNVCRRMYPNQSGSGLPGTWNAGDDSTIVIKAALPTYIYDINQLAVVAFIQDNGTKDVLQAGYSISPVGIQSHSNSLSDFNLYPNPAGEAVNMNCTLESDAEVVINIYNSLGILVATENKGTRAAGKHQFMINLEQLATGMYTVELLADQKRSTSMLNVIR